jgi:hypothetical protein
MELQNQLVSAWIGTAIFGNLQISYKILIFIFDKRDEYKKLINRVTELERTDEKKTKDLNAAHEMIRELKNKVK